MQRIKIVVNNHKSKMEGDERAIGALRERTKLRSPGAWYSPAYHKKQWDGYIRCITEANYFFTGLLPFFIDEVAAYNKTVKEKFQIEIEHIEDNREHFKPIKEIVTVGDKTLRDYQLAAVQSLKDTTIGGLKFPRGILNEATNAGKSLIAAALYKSYNTKRIALLLINNKTIYFQLVKEIGELLGNDIVGEVSAEKVSWKKFNICMVQTLANRISKNPKIKQDVQNCDIVMVDEGDELINRKDCQKVLQVAFAAPIRICLTGTALKNKDKIKNRKCIEYFGPVIHRTSNTDLIAQGVSTKPIITFSRGNDEVSFQGDYDSEYTMGIIENKKRHKRVWARVRKRIDQGRYPIIILVRYKNHITELLKSMPQELTFFNYVYVHGETQNNERVFEEFNKKKIDILISSMIIKRGKNLPAIRTLVNAAGGDSETSVLQILGRALRKDKDKDRVYLEEFFDGGIYLRRHSRHRINYYIKDGHKIKEPYKKYMKKYN